MSYADWYSMIKSNFESQFFVSATSLDSLINVRNIYKDTVGAANGFGDFQLRPNFLVAMVAAPELFNPSNAILALGTVHEKLLCKLGLKTLDESDWNYNGDYYNMDSSDPKTAGGFNYHQGPVCYQNYRNEFWSDALRVPPITTYGESILLNPLFLACLFFRNGFGQWDFTSEHNFISEEQALCQKQGKSSVGTMSTSRQMAGEVYQNLQIKVGKSARPVALLRRGAVGLSWR